MLIEDYDLELFTPPCEPGAEKRSAIARLKVDISEVLPVLEGMTQAGVEAGLPAEDARRVAAQVMLGTASLIL